MNKSEIQAVINLVEQKFPGLRQTNRFRWTELVATECYAFDHTVGQKRADLGRPVSDDTIGWVKEGSGWSAVNGTPGSAHQMPFTAVDLLDGSTGAIHFNEIDLTQTSPLQYFVIPPSSGGSSPSPQPPANTVPFHPYDGDQKWVPVSQQMEADYKEANGHGLDGGCGMWIARTIHDCYMGENAGVPPLTLEASIAKHRKEWRAALGLPPGLSLGGIVIPTGQLIGSPLLQALRIDGCRGIRQVAKQLPPSQCWALANEILTAGLIPYLSIEFAEQMIVVPVGSRTLVGFENEPDLRNIPPDVYARRFGPAVTLAAEMGLRLYGPEISNLNERGFHYLRQLPWDAWPVETVGCSFHRYPELSGFSTPHPGSDSREAEVDTLRKIVGQTRPLLVGEVGYNTLDFTEDQQAEYLGLERQFWARMGVEWVFCYQLIDGPDPTSASTLDHYGLQTAAGREKPAKAVFLREWM